MRTETPDPPEAALTSVADANDPTRTIYGRPLDDLEIARGILFPSLSVTPPSVFSASQPLVLRDPRGVALVPLVNGSIPPPFVDANGDGLADLDALGDFVTLDGSPVPSPFFSVDGVDGARQSGLALNGTAPMYGYFDTSSTILAKVAGDLGAALQPYARPAGRGAPPRDRAARSRSSSGAEDPSPMSQKVYPPDPSSPEAWALQHPTTPPPPNLATAPVVLSYAGYHAETSPLADLTYAIGQVLADPTTDDTLNLFRQIVTNHPQQLARLVGVGLQIKAIANAHPEAHIPAASTLWDELLDVFAAIGACLRPRRQAACSRISSPRSGPIRPSPLKDAFTAYIDYRDVLTYQNAQQLPAAARPT